MKKSIVIIIGIIYVASICLIGFFGMKIKAYNETIYVTNVECLNKDMRDGTDSQDNPYKYVILTYKLNLAYQIEWKVYPENASNRNIEFSYDTSTTVANVNYFGAVTFNKKGTITIQIKSTDGGNRGTTIKIIAR
ncbi:MAG: Ig-like domain-containing protein [Clostridia bacterium]|nr:Ig-like domain-containing protein [Clostridia bacterium]